MPSRLKRADVSESSSVRLNLNIKHETAFSLCHTSKLWEFKPVPFLKEFVGRGTIATPTDRFPEIGYMKSAMPIRGFLAGQAFEPEVVRQMSLALETICGKFGMKLADDPATRVVALKIIELAQRGARDAPTLTEMTLKELEHYLPYAADRG
jgi:hypothetical protein